MSKPLGLPDVLRFGDDFELDVSAYQLRSAGIPLKLKPIPMELLLFLMERQGELVTRDQIAERIWGKGVFLDTDNSINGAISKIRQVLRDAAEQPRYVETVTGRGYRFIAPVVKAGPSPALEGVPSQTSAAERVIGKRISHYRILQILGGGGMGVVYKAEDLKLGRRVAIKFLPAEMASDPKAFARLEREARAASALEHPNICPVYELGEHEGEPFIVMQLLEGRTLREWIEFTASQGNAQRLQPFLDIAVQIADGLDAAHQMGIIHRDIKPANIFITNRGEAKILDFGVARFLAVPEGADVPTPARQADMPPSLGLTRTGSSMGTPFYLSPEQIRGEKLDARTDLFSFGLVLYEMATGQRAFAGNTAPVIREAVLNQPSVPVRQLNSELPLELERVIGKLLEKNRERRYQSAKELRANLERLRSGTASAARKPIRRSVWLIAGIAAIVLLISFLVARTRLGLNTSDRTLSWQVSPRRSVAVLGFKNLSGRTDEDWISTALAEMLNTELAAGQQLRTIPSENVARMKLDLSLTPADSYSADTLSRIRGNLGADIVVLGSYLAMGKNSGGRIRVDLHLQDTRAGETLASVSADGHVAELADLISRCGFSLRQTLGISTLSFSDVREVQASVPSNPEAARFYAEGLSKLRVFDALAARHLLEKALLADPGHALSHAALAESWSELGYDAKAQEEAKRAFELSANLSREERLSIEGRYQERMHNFPSAIEIYLTLRNFFPDNLDYALRLASVQLNAGRGKDALETVARMRRLPEPESKDARIDLTDTYVGEALGDFKRTQQAASTAAAKAESQGSRLLVAQAKEREGWALQQLGNLDGAISKLSESRDLFAGAGNLRASATVMVDIADVIYDRGDFVGARKILEESLGIFRQTGAQQQTALALSAIGDLLYDQGALQEAKKYQEEALHVDREIGNGIERDLSNLANVFEALGNLPAAVQARQQAVQGFHGIGDKTNEAMTLTNLGGVLLSTGELAPARQALDKAIALQQEIGHKRGLGFSLFFLAEWQRAHDLLEGAQTTIEQDIALRKELGDDVHLPESQIQLAEIALEQENSGEAESLARTAAAAFDQQKITDLGAQSYAVISRALLDQGKFREAQIAADHAMVLSRLGGDLKASFDAVFAVAAVKAAAGNVTEATKMLEGVRAEVSRRGYSGYELKARLRLGELEIRSGNTSSGRAHLEQLQSEAKQKGFLLIARKAATARN